MDINTQLDGFIIHPLDAFKNSQQEEFIPPISSSTPDFDEFQVHPLIVSLHESIILIMII